MNSLEYIASGLGYIRITLKDLDDRPDKREIIKNIFNRLNTETEHKFGFLFNAWTEQKYGERLEEYKPYVNSVHCDSGGLQIITRDMKITEEMKKDIYKTQAKYCDVAMSFDEIPVTTTNGASSRNDTTNRFFNEDIFEDCAKQTGKNLLNQIKAFEEYKTKAKPLLIVQGNDIFTYQKWTELVLKEIPKNYHDNIGGVAMGAAALGTGSLEDIIRAFAVKQLPFDVKHLHILGVGSAIRLIPVLIFMKNGLYEDIHISYDSTSHTSGMIFGRYYDIDGWLKFTNKYEDIVLHPKMYKQIVEEFDLDNIIDYKSMLDIMKHSNSTYAEKTNKCQTDVVIFMTALAASSIKNFMNHIDLLLKSKNNILNFIEQYENRAIFETLFKIKTLEDFNQWEKQVGRFISSSRISKEQNSNLESFFG